MKELSIEEKARRYDEVVNKLKGFMAQGVDPLITRADAQDFFPELKENEDESIRKSLAAYFANFKPDYMWDDDFSFGDIVAWLEKQGGHAKFINGIQVGDKVTRNEDGVLFNLSQLNRVAKKQGEQKEYDVCDFCEQRGGCIDPCSVKLLDKYGMKDPADGAEPKFKVGDWIIKDNYSARQVSDARKESYTLVGSIYGIETLPKKHVEQNYHLWTIQDAKDGDVLATNSWLFMFKYTNNKALIQFHCNCPINGTPYKWCWLSDDSYLDIYIDANIHPATKEQRDLLFQKMHEAGYEWDAEKKELKKIEQKPLVIPKFRKGDFIRYKTNPDDVGRVDCVMDDYYILDIKGECTHVLFTCQDLWELVEQKPAEWSEEDESILNTIIIALSYMNKIKQLSTDIYDEQVEWLKSLRPQTTWKPSDEQNPAEWSEEDEKMWTQVINEIEAIKSNSSTVFEKNIAQDKIDWLKSLKERVQPQNITVTDEELAQAKKEAYNDALDKIEYHSGEPTFDDGWGAAIWYLKKRNAQPKNTWKPSESDIRILEQVIGGTINPINYHATLYAILEQLKKLREE